MLERAQHLKCADSTKTDAPHGVEYNVTVGQLHEVAIINHQTSTYMHLPLRKHDLDVK